MSAPPERAEVVVVGGGAIGTSIAFHLAEAGVTRLSLGLQSFDDGVLKRLGRAHRAEEGVATN